MKSLLVKSAIEQKPIEIIYESKTGTITQRCITIKKLNQKKLLAYCHTKKQYRSFNIEQILAAQPIKKIYTTPA